MCVALERITGVHIRSKNEACLLSESQLACPVMFVPIIFISGVWPGYTKISARRIFVNGGMLVCRL